MQEDLPALTRELRKENCPQRVLDEAARRIAAEMPAPSRFRFAIPLALAALLLLCALLVRSQLTSGYSKSQPQPELVEQPARGGTQVARDTEKALGLIGAVLLNASAHSETVISARAIPPLRNGLQTATDKIIRHTEL